MTVVGFELAERRSVFGAEVGRVLTGKRVMRWSVYRTCSYCINALSEVMRLRIRSAASGKHTAEYRITRADITASKQAIDVNP